MFILVEYGLAHGLLTGMTDLGRPRNLIGHHLGLSDSVARRSARLALFDSSVEMTVRPASFKGVMSISSMAQYR